MPSVLIVSLLVLAGACRPPAPIDVGGEGEGEASGEGEGEAGEGEGEAVVDATLDELAATWDELACGLYACVKRARPTESVCAAAASSDEDPFDTFSEARAVIAAGRAVFDVERGNACRELLASLASFDDACFGPGVATFEDAVGDDFRATCGALADGIVADGGACDDDAECADGPAGSVCPREQFPDCVGQCVTLKAVGESCAEQQFSCVREAFCDGERCVARALANDGAFCVDANECQSGKCFDFTCVQQSDVDGECAGDDDDCIEGAYCRPLPPSTGQLGICQEPSLPGGACGFALRCVGNQSCAGHFRRFNGGNVDGACQQQPADVGDPCTPVPDDFDFGDTGCFADLVCDAATSLCAEPPALDAACVDGRCGFQAFCDDGGVCRAQKANGETATAVQECQSGFFDSFDGVCFDPDERGPCG